MATPTNSQRSRTLQEKTTPLTSADVLAEAKVFFSRRNGIYAAFLEQESGVHVTFRGQGGEEIVIGTVADARENTRVTASTYLFDQQVARFLDNLPSAPPETDVPGSGTGDHVQPVSAGDP